jgi:hydrogenase maturation protein HypF
VTNTATETGGRAAMRLRVTGLVQGVGFRPFVHRLATRHRLAGWVRNASGDVQIEIEGGSEDVAAFVRQLRDDAPPLARIEHIETERRAPAGLRVFAILASERGAPGRQPVSPDVALCARCEAELFQPRNRRHRYPFITCTDCGPRCTVIEEMPYDRERTSMRAFQQCPECLREYRSPGDRRYHSETNSCADCGPMLWLEGERCAVRGEQGVLNEAAQHIRNGAILAIRGLGGFHLAVDATNDAAVKRLRQRKHREAKPFAIMVRTVDQAQKVGVVGPAEEWLLTGPERPVVVLHARTGSPVATAVAPELDTIGVMLAYTPMQHLLLDLVERPLVMTSGNRSQEPIAISLSQARDSLHNIADVFLMHDREIVARYDDSVVRLMKKEPVFLRRARGYAPLPVPVPIPTPRPLVAVGPQLKNTFTLLGDDRAYVSQHIGDLDDVESTEHFLETLRLYQRLFRIEPSVAVRDAHPDYLSSRIAEDLGIERVISVQHHHAHVAAVMAEHGETRPVVGIAFDGSGYGDDGTSWGGELLVADLLGYGRAAHLRCAPLPGGDLGARRPWRAAMGYLSLDSGAASAFRSAFVDVPPREYQIAQHQIEHRLNAPVTSSIGRLFDAAAAVLGVRNVAEYEGQAAMELEALAGTRAAAALPFPITSGADGWLLEPLPLLVALGEGLGRGLDPADLAAAFHESVAARTAELALRICDETGIGTVVLSGGVFQNARLLDRVRQLITETGARVLVPRRLPPNDGAVSYGQAAIAAAQLHAEQKG